MGGSGEPGQDVSDARFNVHLMCLNISSNSLYIYILLYYIYILYILYFYYIYIIYIFHIYIYIYIYSTILWTEVKDVLS